MFKTKGSPNKGKKDAAIKVMKLSIKEKPIKVGQNRGK